MGFHIFDTHTHIGEARHSGRSVSAEALLRNMDTHGIDRSVVIPFPVVEDCRRQHDIIGHAVRLHPDRLVGVACLSPFLPQADFRDEIRRCREQYGFQALKLQPQYHGLNPLSESGDLFFEAALENDMIVICHTGSGTSFFSPIPLYDAGPEVSGVEDSAGPLWWRNLLSGSDRRGPFLSEYSSRTVNP